jgi:hypothetical protein
MRGKRNILLGNINIFVQNKVTLMRINHRKTDDGKRPSLITVKTIN